MSGASVGAAGALSPANGRGVDCESESDLNRCAVGDHDGAPESATPRSRLRRPRGVLLVGEPFGRPELQRYPSTDSRWSLQPTAYGP